MGMAISVPTYTVDDLDKFPDDGNRYELLDGMLLVTPASSAAHQIIASRLQFRLSAAVVASGHAHVVGPGAIVVRPRRNSSPTFWSIRLDFLLNSIGTRSPSTGSRSKC
jgi:Uma2 family endonuclease